MPRHRPHRPLCERAARWLTPLGLCTLPLLMTASHALAQAGAACRPGGSVDETNACAVQAYQAADTRLAILYGEVMRGLPAAERPHLRQEHSTWQRERVTHCKQAHQADEARPEWPRLYHECLARDTEARRQHLLRGPAPAVRP